jgi:hypothetical protein
LCKMQRVTENLNLGTQSSSTATSYPSLLANTQLFSAGVIHSASSPVPGGLITCTFKDLWTLLGREPFKFSVILSSSWCIHLIEIGRKNSETGLCSKGSLEKVFWIVYIEESLRGFQKVTCFYTNMCLRNKVLNSIR